MIDLKKTTKTQEDLLKLIENRDWLEDNLKEIQDKYAEKWVAIAERKLVGSGSSPDEAMENIKGSLSSMEVLLISVPKGEISQPI